MLWAVHLRWDPAQAAFRTTRPDDEVARVLAAMFTSGLVHEAGSAAIVVAIVPMPAG